MNKLEVTFVVHHTACSCIVQHGVELIRAKFDNMLTEFDVELVLQRLQMYIGAISQKAKVQSLIALTQRKLFSLDEASWNGGFKSKKHRKSVLGSPV